MSVTYDPRIFLCATEQAARAIILTPEAGLSTEDRWEQETAWLTERMSFPEGVVIDYGCGIGRLAKVLRNPVLGVDLSPSMRAQAETYVMRSDFGVVSPAMFTQLVTAGLRVAGALTVWCLQHCVDPAADIALLHKALIPTGVLYVVNRPERFVPAQFDGQFHWANDGQDVGDLLISGGFRPVESEVMPEALCAPGARFSVYSRA